MAKEALERGGGKACKATHNNGCRHYGILDLRPMDSKNYSYYSKCGGWLQDKCCINCCIDTKDMTADKYTRNYLHYCEMGLKSIKYNLDGTNNEKKYFMDHDCNTILCVPCWNSKVLVHEQELKEQLGTGTKRCSTRKKM